MLLSDVYPAHTLSFDLPGGITTTGGWSGLRYLPSYARFAVVSLGGTDHYHVTVWDSQPQSIYTAETTIAHTAPINVQMVVTTGATPATSAESVQIVLNGGAWSSPVVGLSASPLGNIAVYSAIADSGSVRFDNVKLVSIPEPNTCVLLVIGGLMLLAPRRRTGE